MKVNVSNRDGKMVFGLAGRFDFNATREFRDVIEQAIKGTPREVLIDLGSVDYIDSSALGMLLMLRDKAKAAGKEVSLGGARGTVRQVIDIANFGKLFPLV